MGISDGVRKNCGNSTGSSRGDLYPNTDYTAPIEYADAINAAGGEGNDQSADDGGCDNEWE